MAHTDVDKVNGFVIRKLHSPDKTKTYGFLTLPEDYDGKDNTLVRRHPNMTAAREHLGFEVKVDPIKQTKPKDSYAQNKKGYKYDNSNSGASKKRA